MANDVDTLNNAVACKRCGSIHVRKYGFIEGTQRYFCNDCRHKFSANDQLYRMKTPANQVSSALNMYYEGMSINGVRRHLQQEYSNYPSSKTVFGWINKSLLSKLAKNGGSSS